MTRTMRGIEAYWAEQLGCWVTIPEREDEDDA